MVLVNTDETLQGMIRQVIEAWQTKQESVLPHILAIDRYLDSKLRLGSVSSGLIALTSTPSPIVFSNPHGCLEDINFEPRRKSSRSDYLTRYLTFATMIECGEDMPSFIGPRFHRKYMELNRAPSEGAYADQRLSDVYWNYYSNLRHLLRIAERKHGNALLLDIHGFDPNHRYGEQRGEFSAEREAILDHDGIIGTGHRVTVKGSDLDHVLARCAAAEDLRFYVPDAEKKNGEIFGGGRLTHIVLSSELSATAGIQLEVHMRHRRTYEAATAFAERFARVIRQLGDYIRHHDSRPVSPSHQETAIYTAK